MEFKKLIVVVFKFYLGTNLFFMVFGTFKLVRLNKLYEHRNEFKKVRVLVDTLYLYSMGSTDGPNSDTYWVKYNKQLRDSFLIEDIADVIIKVIREKNQNNDSIYVWHHPTLEDSYAMPSHTKYEDSFDKTNIRNLVILFFIAIITLVYLLFKHIKKRWKKIKF
ncbi:hypothetical protein NACSLCCMFF_60112 [Tenacibaculum maritimum]|uniref:hypothetical protein n=1 Tax=Tenacibaculum maritimum TaxID=107401 RepID=UPI0012E6012B|nr:hypothetical protein [Tenacibaculum maritimum]CAA0244581.1 hypothetical protein NACSLCCMFF_60112 [Tenacibaculum maritimum]